MTFTEMSFTCGSAIVKIKRGAFIDWSRTFTNVFAFYKWKCGVYKGRPYNMKLERL